MCTFSIEFSYLGIDKDNENHVLGIFEDLDSCEKYLNQSTMTARKHCRDYVKKHPESKAYSIGVFINAKTDFDRTNAYWNLTDSERDKLNLLHLYFGDWGPFLQSYPL